MAVWVVEGLHQPEESGRRVMVMAMIVMVIVVMIMPGVVVMLR